MKKYLLIFFLVAPATVFGSTTISSGTLDSSATWTADNGPYIIQNTLLNIPDGITLSIENGTEVRFDRGTGMYVGQGANLNVVGTKANPVVFTSNDVNPVVGDYSVSVDGTTDIKYTQFGFADKALEIGNGGNAVIDSSTFDNNTDGVFVWNGGSASITNSIFKNNDNGVDYFYPIFQFRNILRSIFQTAYADTVNPPAVSISQSSFQGNRSFAVKNKVFDVKHTTLEATNNYWGSATGPTNDSNPSGTGDQVSNGVVFDPWLTHDPFAKPTHNPVIIVPGIMGSELYKDDGTEVWMNLFKMALPGDDSYLNELKLSDTGASLVALKPTDIIRNVHIPLLVNRDMFDGLVTTLQGMGYTENVDLFTFPYDWRFDIDGVSPKLQEYIEKIKAQTGSNQVDLISHSMGGLLFKQYLKLYGGSSIAKFLDIATPHLGSPSSFATLSYGDTGISSLNMDTIKAITQNMPSVYELLPSQKYFDDTDPNYTYYVFNGVDTNNRLNFDQTKDYLKTAGRNSALVDRADVFHQEVDGLDPATYGVKTYNIVGCGTPTIGQFYILDKKSDGTFDYNIRMINGDGTVPIKSAEAIPALKTYFVKGAQHPTISSFDGVKQVVASILNGNDNPDITPYSNIVVSDTDCPVPDGKIVSFHSPITLNIYDTQGNHTGPNADGDIENNIPGVEYETIEDNKFAFIPNGQDYKIVGDATGAGTFDARIETMMGGEVTNTVLFNDVPIDSNSQAKFTVGLNVPTEIAIDKNGDGVFDTSIPVSKNVVGFLESTGKDKPVEVVHTTPVSFGGGGGGGSTHKTILISYATTTPRASTTLVTIGAYPKPKGTKIATSIPRSKVQNTATVYKSTSIIKMMFKSLWSWFKSKI